MIAKNSPHIQLVTLERPEIVKPVTGTDNGQLKESKNRIFNLPNAQNDSALSTSLNILSIHKAQIVAGLLSAPGGELGSLGTPKRYRDMQVT